MTTKTIRVEYEAAGGHLHAWRSGVGRFTMTVPAAATVEQAQTAAEAEALRRARRRIGHNAGLGTVTMFAAHGAGRAAT